MGRTRHGAASDEWRRIRSERNVCCVRVVSVCSNVFNAAAQDWTCRQRILFFVVVFFFRLTDEQAWGSQDHRGVSTHLTVFVAQQDFFPFITFIYPIPTYLPPFQSLCIKSRQYPLLAPLVPCPNCLRTSSRSKFIPPVLTHTRL